VLLIAAWIDSGADGQVEISGLQVRGNRLIDPAGEQVVLRGVNRMGFEYSCVTGRGLFDGGAPLDQASVDAMKSWGVNAVRLPLNEHCWLGVAGSPSGETYRQGVESYVNLLVANNMYVLLDLHWSAPAGVPADEQQAMPNTSYSVDFWKSVASRPALKNNGRVLFDLFNEPLPNNNDDDGVDDDRRARRSWECWRDGAASGSCDASLAISVGRTMSGSQAVGMQALVNAVRGVGATNVIVLGGIQWANTLWSSATRNVLTYKPSDPLNNLAASFHLYNWSRNTSISSHNLKIAPIAAQMPVILGEFGNNSCDATWMNALMNWYDANGVGYMAWTWGTYNAAGCSAMKLVLDYAGTPSQYGRIFRDHLAIAR
jgi:aryl-phospho-beta-D-glucosidase BglC (GH1 family)